MPQAGMALGALILTGGASRRMGRDKAETDWNGQRAVDRLYGLALSLGAEPVFTVGRRAYGLPAITDEAPDGGPALGLGAGVAGLRAAGCDRALALAVDAPTLLLEDLAPLLRAPGAGAAYEGLHLPAVFVLALAPTPEAGWALGRFMEAAGVARLAAPGDAAARRLRGANTPEERDALLEALAEREGAWRSGAG